MAKLSLDSLIGTGGSAGLLDKLTTAGGKAGGLVDKWSGLITRPAAPAAAAGSPEPYEAGQSVRSLVMPSMSMVAVGLVALAGIVYLALRRR